VPFARAINPITKTNWEGTGVEPDIKVPASEALEVAKKMAAEQIKKR
jgi:C-terminal processing protease CtpA/Prc